MYISCYNKEQHFFAHKGFVLEKVTMGPEVLMRILMSSPLITLPVLLHGALPTTDFAAIQI